MNQEYVGENFYTDNSGIKRNEFFSQYINMISVQVLDHGYFDGDARWNQFGISSPFSRIYYMVGYSGWIEESGKRMDLIPGKMYLITPYTVVNLRTTSKICKYFFHVTVNVYDYDVFENYNKCYELDMKQTVLDELSYNFHQEDLDAVLRMRALLTYTIAQFIGAYMPDIAKKIKIAVKYREIHQLIDRSLQTKINAQTVAQHLKVSLQRLNKEYKNDTGISITKYIHSQLVSKASKLLLLTNKSVKEIAYELGFNDEFYFSRFFKKEMNYGPREYRYINGHTKTKVE